MNYKKSRIIVTSVSRQVNFSKKRKIKLLIKCVFQFSRSNGGKTLFLNEKK